MIDVHVDSQMKWIHYTQSVFIDTSLLVVGISTDHDSYQASLPMVPTRSRSRIISLPPTTVVSSNTNQGYINSPFNSISMNNYPFPFAFEICPSDQKGGGPRIHIERLRHQCACRIKGMIAELDGFAPSINAERGTS